MKRHRIETAIRAGTVLDLSGSDRGLHFRRERPQQVSADLLREVITRRDSSRVDPRGLRLRGARIAGQLDLTDARIDVPLAFENCLFDEPLLLSRAHVQRLSLHGSSVPALEGSGLIATSDIVLSKLEVRASSAAGALRFPDARITGSFSLGNAHLQNDNGPTLVASGMTVGGDIIFDELRAKSGGQHGAVYLINACIASQFRLVNASISCDGGISLVCDNLRVGGMLYMKGITAFGRGRSSAVRFSGARVSSLSAGGHAEIENPEGPALSADGIYADGGVKLDGLIAFGYGDLGVVRLLGAHVGGQLSLGVGARLSNDQGPALAADRMEVAGGVYLDGLIAEGNGARGTVRLSGARIEGGLSLALGTRVKNSRGPALCVDSMEVAGDFQFQNFIANASSEEGGVEMHGSQIGGWISLADDVQLVNESGPTISADSLEVSGVVYLEGRSEGVSDQAVVQLRNGNFKGGLYVDAEVVNHRKTGVNFDFRGSNVEGPLALWTDGYWENLSKGQGEKSPLLELNHLTYGMISRPKKTEVWLQILENAMPSYASQPYEQLAKVCRDVGDEKGARTVLIAKQEALGRSGGLSKGSRLWHGVTGVTSGYGYRPGLALLILVCVITAYCDLAVMAEQHGLLRHPASSGSGSCSIIESIGYAIDRAIPLVRLGAADRCELVNGADAQWYFLTSLFLQLLGWVFFTLFVAGLSGVIQKKSSK